MVANEIPLSPQNQKFQATLAGVTYTLRLRWCPPALSWTLDISTAEDVPIITGIPLITGTNLLKQYAYAGIGGALYVQSDDSVFKPPTFENLGTISHLYFVTPSGT